MKVEYYGETNIGKVRTNNEDAFLLQEVWKGTHLLAVVVDGVGGYCAGEVAADLACKCISEHIVGTGESINSAEVLQAAVIYANNTIISQQRNPMLNRMSCVLTAALIDTQSGIMNVVHVGDTRLYAYEDGKLTKLTSDHSLVGPLEESGQITEEQAMAHPRRNIITRCIGERLLQFGTNYLQCQTLRVEPPCTLMLCSDGLYDMITSAQSSAVIGQTVPLQNRTQQLINAALDAGDKDNVTVCLVDITE